MDVGASLIKLIDNAIGMSGEGKLLQFVMDGLAFSIKVVGSILIGALTAVQAFADGIVILQNKGKELLNFFGADFKIDTTATFENLQKNAEKNLNQIAKLWEDTAKKGVEAQQKANEEITKDGKKTETKLTDEQLKEIEKRKKAAEKLAQDKAKANLDLIKKIEDMDIKSIADDTKRAKAKADLDYKREKDSIKKTLASTTTKNKALQTLEKSHEAAIRKIDDDAKKKQEKLDADAIKKAEAEKKKALGEDKKRKDQSLKDTQELLDNEFKAEVSKAKINLELTVKNSQEMWDAKRNLLEIEAKYKAEKLRLEAEAEKKRIDDSKIALTNQLQDEANAERKRINESIVNKTERDAQIKQIDDATQAAILLNNTTSANKTKAIDDRLTAELTLNETRLQNDKKKLNAEANAVREKNNEEFYKGLNLAMSGDFNAFSKFLKDKAVADGKQLNQRTENFAKHAQQVGEVMTSAVNALIKLNADYTKRQLDNLSKEKETAFKKLDDELAKGIKTKEQVDAEKTKLQAKFDADSLTLKKKEFETNKRLNIANAVIAGSMAVLQAFAMPWPVGLVMGVIAAAKTVYDISNIKKQTFQGKSGGVFKNAGVAQGSAHGNKYGDAGIVMYDRMSGAEVGEIEGNEPVMVLSQKTYANNKPIIDKLLDSSLNKNGSPISMQDGGVYYLGRNQSTVDGGRKMIYRDGGIINRDSDVESSGEMINDNKRHQEEMKKIAESTARNTSELLNEAKRHSGILVDIRNKDNGAGSILHAIDRLGRNSYRSNF
jgi:hypothetical protein